MSQPVKACNAGRTFRTSFPSASNFFHIDETPLVTCSCNKQNHVCQVLYEVKEENGDTLLWESDENG